MVWSAAHGTCRRGVKNRSATWAVARTCSSGVSGGSCVYVAHQEGPVAALHEDGISTGPEVVQVTLKELVNHS